MSKAIYKPKGKAGEYAEWACNLYVGCSNNCSYCYCKRGVLGHVMGAPVPTLKKCFRDPEDAFNVFVKELDKNLTELQKSSLFFTFSSDPMIPETRYLNWKCILRAVGYGVKCQVLTKNADFIYQPQLRSILLNRNITHYDYRKNIAFGFTLTGRDDLEPGASTNAERCETMRTLHQYGYRTFASLEPVVDPMKTVEIIYRIRDYCDLIKVGLMSGKSLSEYNRGEVERIASWLLCSNRPYYLKKSITDYLGMPPQTPIDIFKIKRV
ncbi:MAG: hypothetical protein J6Y20_04555 [Lachnospiraceae bacterium]|nr:hypothetical protein [Kiritimatiellia bacterium]MBP5461376.1 hypothetical protein [Lachnospiraceae bacterium]